MLSLAGAIPLRASILTAKLAKLHSRRGICLQQQRAKGQEDLAL